MVGLDAVRTNFFYFIVRTVVTTVFITSVGLFDSGRGPTKHCILLIHSSVVYILIPYTPLGC